MRNCAVCHDWESPCLSCRGIVMYRSDGVEIQPSTFVDSALADLRRAVNELDRALASGAQPAAAIATARQRAQDAVDVLEGAGGVHRPDSAS